MILSMAYMPLLKLSLQTLETNFTSKKIKEVRMLRKSRSWLLKKKSPSLEPQKNPCLK